MTSDEFLGAAMALLGGGHAVLLMDADDMIFAELLPWGGVTHAPAIQLGPGDPMPERDPPGE